MGSTTTQQLRWDLEHHMWQSNSIQWLRRQCSSSSANGSSCSHTFSNGASHSIHCWGRPCSSRSWSGMLWLYDPWSSRGTKTANCRRPASGASQFQPDVSAGWFAGWLTLLQLQQLLLGLGLPVGWAEQPTQSCCPVVPVVASTAAESENRTWTPGRNMNIKIFIFLQNNFIFNLSINLPFPVPKVIPWKLARDEGVSLM